MVTPHHMLRSQIRSRWLRGTPWLLAGVAVLTRLPSFFASRHLTFDDGVFGASAVAMRHGGVPFRDVFSSQGPLFLPLVWFADLVGARTLNAPRLLTVASGVAVTLATYHLSRRISGHRPAVLASLVVALTGSVMWVTGPVAADGPGLAFGASAAAVAFSYRQDPTVRRAVAIGILAGAAFSIKSAFAIPPGLAVAWVFLESRRWRHLLAGLSSSAALVLVVSVPWGVADVWDQAVAYHFEAEDPRDPVGNGRKIMSTLWDRDLLVLATATVGAGVALADRRRHIRRRARSSTGLHRPTAPVVVWLLGALVLLLAVHPLWRPHLAHLTVPLAILGAHGLRHTLADSGGHLRRSGRLVLVGFVTVLGVHLATNTDILRPQGPRAVEARVLAELRLLPRDAVAISDDPGLVWRAGLRTPHDLVDTSFLRIESGRITRTGLLAEASRPEVCAVAVWESRRHFASLELDADLRTLGYRPAVESGDFRVLYMRDECPDETVNAAVPNGRELGAGAPAR